MLGPSARSSPYSFWFWERLPTYRPDRGLSLGRRMRLGDLGEEVKTQDGGGGDRGVSSM